MKVSVFVGRLDPLHLGHINTITTMIEEKDKGGEAVVFLGSVNSHLTGNKTLFNYQERRGFLRKRFPGVLVLPLPDMNNLGLWHIVIKDLLSVFCPFGPKEEDVTFYCGVETDVSFLEGTNYKTRVVDRTIDGISATKVRSALGKGDLEFVSTLLDSLVENDIIANYYKKKVKEL